MHDGEKPFLPVTDPLYLYSMISTDATSFILYLFVADELCHNC
jgi:hypothetical protein